MSFSSHLFPAIDIFAVETVISLIWGAAAAAPIVLYKIWYMHIIAFLKPKYSEYLDHILGLLIKDYRPVFYNTESAFFHR